MVISQEKLPRHKCYKPIIGRLLQPRIRHSCEIVICSQKKHKNTQKKQKTKHVEMETP